MVCLELLKAEMFLVSFTNLNKYVLQGKPRICINHKHLCCE